MVLATMMKRSFIQAASIALPLSAPARFTTPSFTTVSRATYSSESKDTKKIIDQAKSEGKDAKIVVDRSEGKTESPKLIIEEKEALKPDEIAGGKPPGQRKKTILELDEELKLKLEGISGDGGASGLEYEDGKAVAMKRGVRDNMFRYI